jgi:uracil-DNA glycosylase family 4
MNADRAATAGETPIATPDGFRSLVAAAQACRQCPAMEGRRRVLGELNGRHNANVMFIAEAPGRLGGELSGRPLIDDASGRHFTALLAEAGIAREDVFITNSVLCNPQDAAGRNRKPSRRELQNCRGWLMQQIAEVDPTVILTLGSVALEALAYIAPHEFRLRSHAALPQCWAGRTLIPLYHPSPLTRASRTDAQQALDYHALGNFLREGKLL